VSRSLQGLHRNSAVVVTALIALLAMHGLSSDHAMGVPGGHMTTTVAHAVGPEQENVSGSTMSEQMTTAMTAAVASMSDQMGHAGGMCVGILGAGLLLWLLARAARHRLGTFSAALCQAVRTFPARDGPPTARLCPSLVQLCILRT